MTNRTYTMEDLDIRTERAADRAEAECLRATIALAEYHHKKIIDELKTKLGKIEVKIRYEREQKKDTHVSQ